jgi:hypothetical protein
MKKIQTPRFLSNLYRDMRDRRMLLPAIALVVALIAVPVLLTKSSASAPPPAPTAAGGPGGEGSATEPAVVTEQLGVTDYRKRLDQLNSKDPFRRHFTTLPKSAKLTTTSSPSATSSSTAGTSSTSGLSTSATSSGSVSGSSTVSPSTTTTTSSGSGSSNSNSSTSPSSLTLYSFRVSVAVGPAGDLTNRDNVKRTAYLPGKNRPLVSYVGVSEDTKHAIFSVSRDVSSVRGDGRCYPSRGNCNFLRLKPGDKASLDYAPEGDRTYNLKLREIKLVATSKHHKGGSNKIASQPLLGPDG